MKGSEPQAEPMYGIADQGAQEAFREDLRADPEVRRLFEDAREAGQRGDPPTNPVSLAALEALIDDARRARAPRPR